MHEGVHACVAVDEEAGRRGVRSRFVQAHKRVFSCMHVQRHALLALQHPSPNGLGLGTPSGITQGGQMCPPFYVQLQIMLAFNLHQASVSPLQIVSHGANV